jgi:hypothetical protein
VPSSISGSEPGRLAFPLRVAAATVAILILYNAVIALAHPDAVATYDQGTLDRVTAARYLDAEPTPPAVLAGTSLAFTLSADYLREDDLGPDIFNLGLAGLNVTIGLDVILAKRERPRRVYVETNNLDSPDPPRFAASLLAEPWRTLRALAPGFRLENRPLDLVAATATRLARRLRGAELPAQGVYVAGVMPLPTASALDAAQRAFVAARIAQLGRQIDELAAHGTQVVLVPFPVDASLDRTPRAAAIRELELARFPEDRYRWLAIADPQSFQTFDGMHLTIPAGRRLARLLREDNSVRPLGGE